MKLFAAALLASTVTQALAQASSTPAASDISITRSDPQAARAGVSDNFTGKVKVDSLFQTKPPARGGGSCVTFEPGARSARHTHPLGQTLVVTAGVGRVQQWGRAVNEIRPGDVVWIPAGQKHWHGAAPESPMTHIAISESHNGKTVDWMEKVSESQYRAPVAGTAKLAEAGSTLCATEKDVLALSRQMWQWMSDRNTEALAALYNDKVVFVHMSRTLTKTEELDVIKSGNIQYKKVDIQQSSVRFVGSTAIVLTKMRLDAVVGGKEVTNPFMVTEVYVPQDKAWTLASLAFTRLVGD